MARAMSLFLTTLAVVPGGSDWRSFWTCGTLIPEAGTVMTISDLERRSWTVATVACLPERVVASPRPPPKRAVEGCCWGAGAKAVADATTPRNNNEFFMVYICLVYYQPVLLCRGRRTEGF